jgi:hypothetical protein
VPDRLPSYRGYHLDAYQFGMEWQVRAAPGHGARLIPAGRNVGRGRSRDEAYQAAKALVDEFLAEQG